MSVLDQADSMCGTWNVGHLEIRTAPLKLLAATKLIELAGLATNCCLGTKQNSIVNDLVLILRSFRDGFRGSFACTVLAFAVTGVS